LRGVSIRSSGSNVCTYFTPESGCYTSLYVESYNAGYAGQYVLEYYTPVHKELGVCTVFNSSYQFKCGSSSQTYSYSFSTVVYDQPYEPTQTCKMFEGDGIG